MPGALDVFLFTGWVSDMRLKLIALLILCVLTIVEAAQLQSKRNRLRQRRPPTDEEMLRDPQILDHLKVKNDLTDRMKEILRNADEFELLQLEPPFITNRERRESGRLFRGRRVISRVSVNRAKVRRQLLSAWDVGLTYMFNMSMCHDSRHGIRASRGGETVEIIIDFRCGQFSAYAGDESVKGWIRRETGPAFNRVLRQAGLKFRIA